MVSSDHLKWLYVSIPLYFVALLVAAAYAYRQEHRLSQIKGADYIAAHYLGGRCFGPIVTAGTIFASFYSGYTTVGIPTEAYKSGFIALRWLPATVGVIAVYVGTGLRLRRAAMIRGHSSPTDFVTDRYQSQLLRYTIVVLQVVPALIYVAAQVGSLQTTFNSLFNIDIDNPWPVIGLFFLMLAFEWMGGLLSVAITDVVQTVFITAAFLVTAIAVKRNYGGWADIDLATYPRPDFYQTPSADTQWQFWQFSLVGISFFTLPHLLQRVYAARDLQSLRVGWTCMMIGPWFTMFFGVFLGTIGVAILNGKTTSTPAADILEAIMDVGGFSTLAGVMIWTATIAAIMSTADSLLIAISHVLVCEVVYPKYPTSTPLEVVWMGRLISLLAAVFALLIGITWTEGVSDMGKIQFPLSLMATPTFFFGLYSTSRATDVHPWSLAAGGIVSGLYVIVIYTQYLQVSPNPAPIDAGVTGILINLAVIGLCEVTFRSGVLGYVGKKSASSKSTKAVVAAADNSGTDKDENNSGGDGDGSEGSEEYNKSSSLNNARSKTNKSSKGVLTFETVLLYPDRPDWDVPPLKRFGGGNLSPELLWKSMKGQHEPMANLYYSVFLFLLLSVITPLTPPSEPPLDDNFADNVCLVRGMPWWAFKIVMLTAIGPVIIGYALYNMPTSFGLDDEKDIDPELVEMKVEEMMIRTSYDERNRLVTQRRRYIANAQQHAAEVNDDV